MRILRGLRRANQRLDQRWRRQTLGIRVLAFAIGWTLLNAIGALAWPRRTDRWFSTFFGLAMIGVFGLCIAANRLRKHRRVSLEK